MRCEDFLALCANVRTTPNGWDCRCPGHNDEHSSLSVRAGSKGILLACHAGCKPKAICDALHIGIVDLFYERSAARAKIVATYDYPDADGRLLFQVVRMDPKGFRQRVPKPNGGGWDWHLNGTPRVLYRLPELLASSLDDPILVVEGEKDVDNLRAMGFLATTCPQGAGKWSKLRDDNALVGHPVVIISDKDDAGRRHALDVAARLAGRARVVKILELPGDKVKDASDWIGCGGMAGELIELCRTIAVEPAQIPAMFPAAVTDKPAADGYDADGLVPLGSHDPETGKIVLSAQKTVPTAQAFVKKFHDHADGRTIQNYSGMLMTWRDNRYVEVEDDAVRCRLAPWLHDALHYVPLGKCVTLRGYDSNPRTVDSALNSIKTHTFIEKEKIMPSWLDGPVVYPARDILSCKSNNIHIPTGEIVPATPRLFNSNALEFDHDPEAPQPEAWLNFLRELWPDDIEQINTLQQWFGYCLTADTSQQKIMLVVGPKRSGKGTIARVLAQLVGKSNSCGPTTGSLAGQFGMQQLVGKSLAIVSDARFAGPEIQTVVERLLCISGEDLMTIDRKFMPAISMKLPTRFMMLSNEIPRMTDASGALAGRFVMLRLTGSFYGREDTTLFDRLTAELPGILNWALEGWQTLNEQGRFCQPHSVDDAIADMEELASPVMAFVRDCCEVGEKLTSWTGDLYDAWKKWCEQEGRGLVSTKQVFGRDLAAAVPGLKTRQKHGGQRFYSGVGIKGVPPW